MKTVDGKLHSQSSLLDPRRRCKGSSACHTGESCSYLKLPWCWKRNVNKLVLGKLPVTINHEVHEW